MEQTKYVEMTEKLNSLIEHHVIENKHIFLFGHCNATEELAAILLEKSFLVDAILDNNSSKYEMAYKGIPIVSPNYVVEHDRTDSIVLIVTRYYESMYRQLRNLGYKGEVLKLVDYNSYAEYSLTDEAVSQKRLRLENGKNIITNICEKNPNEFRVFCPYSSLGDVYYVMCYLKPFLKKRRVEKAVVCVYTNACREVASLFSGYNIEVLTQIDLDSAVQATLFLEDHNGFIAHNDKPYVMNLTKALHVKLFNFETLYRSGVFGLPDTTKKDAPSSWDDYPKLMDIPNRRSVILSPYAGSVTNLKIEVWNEIRDEFRKKGYTIFTNVAPGENPIEGTEPISPRIREMKSVVERAGIFIGLRSGLCDVIRTAQCRKIAMYPDYYFSDTKWKSIDVFSLDEFENIVIKDGNEWKKIL